MSALKKIRSDNEYKLFWSLVKQEASSLDVSEPQLPRKRRAPRRFEVGSGEHYFPDTVEEYYRRFYFEVLDSTINSIERRFDQPGYRTYKCVENLVLNAAQGHSFDNDFDEVISFYGSDLNPSTLRIQLETLSGKIGDHCTIKEVIEYMKGFSPSARKIYSEINTLLKLILVNPATNAISERSFSAMKRVKTYLRSTMTQERLNAIMVLHVHKQKNDELNLLDIANQFINKEHRLSIFGRFDL